jgi:hypothetical protein
MFVGIVSLMFIFFINYHDVDTIESLSLFYMHMYNADEVYEDHEILSVAYLDPTMVTKALVKKKPKEMEDYIVNFFPRTSEQSIHIPTLQL